MSIFRLDSDIGLGASEATGGWEKAITNVDVYDLDHVGARNRVLGGNGLIIAGGADHILLGKHREALTAFVRRGGRVLVNGHITIPFIDGLARWSLLDYRNPSDLALYRVQQHPVWEGVDHADLLFRTGVPGEHSYEELQDIGVAGFYGRGYHSQLPEGATVLTGIGPLCLPLDYSYAVGQGEVLVHGGWNLEGASEYSNSSRNLGPNLVSWLSAGIGAEETVTNIQGVDA